nr:lysine-rich arabinogalactan protein 19-like [Aegilops tauschii subsp. strangulata]
MSLPPSPPPLPSTSDPPPLPPATSSPMTAITSGTITTTAPAPTTTTADPPPLLTPEEVSGTLRELVHAVRGITLYLAGNQPPPPSTATTAYGPPPLQWPAPAFQAPYGGAPPPPLLLPHYPAAGTPWPAWPTATASLGARLSSSSQRHHRAPRRRRRCSSTTRRRRHRQHHHPRPDLLAGPFTRCNFRPRHRRFPHGRLARLRTRCILRRRNTQCPPSDLTVPPAR